MRKKAWNAVYLSIMALFLVAIIPIKSVNTAASQTKVRMISEVEELGPENAVGTHFKVAVVVENFTDLYGFDFQFKWDTEYIRYVTHTVCVPVEIYPAPNPPSPYEGTLHKPFLEVKNVVNETHPIPDAEPGTMAWLAYASMDPAPPQSGNATIAVFTFEVVNQPVLLNATIAIRFISVMLSDSQSMPIVHDDYDLEIPLYGREQPEGPTLKADSLIYEGPTPHTFDINISIINLNEYWDLGGFDIQLTFDPRFAQVTSITERQFLTDYNFTWKILNEYNNTEGKVWLAYIQYPSEQYLTASGNGTLFTITFTATTCTPLKFIIDPSTGLAGYAHPERPEPPYNNSEFSIRIPYTPVDGLISIVAVNTHTLTVNGVDYTVTTRSNSSVTDVVLYAPIPTLRFRVAGSEEFAGFCNVTIPKELMWSTGENGWLVMIDEQLITPQITQDEKNTYIYFTYPHSTHYVTIITTNIVPEIGNLPLILPLLVMLSAAILASKMRKRKSI